MVSTNNERFLTKPVALGEIVKYLAPQLFFVGLVNGNGNGQVVGGNSIIPAIRDETDSIAYLKHDYNIVDDPKRETPAERVSGTRFPEIDYTKPTLATDVMKSNGFQIRLPRSVIRASSAGSAEEIRSAFETAAYWAGYLINSEIPTALAAGANTTTSYFSPAAEWSNSAAAAPVKDLRNFKRDYEQKDQPFVLTDVLSNEQNFWEMEDYLDDVDITDMQREKIFGTPVVNERSIRVPSVGTIHNVGDDVTEGYLMGIDRNHSAAEYHYYIDEKYSQAKVSFETKIGDTVKRVQVNNIGLHYKSFEDTQDTDDTIMRVWLERTTIVKRPYGILYANGV